MSIVVYQHHQHQHGVNAVTSCGDCRCHSDENPSTLLVNQTL